MYEVFLDDIFFYGVTSVNYPSDRKITVYNGIGTGYFPKADDPNLKKWSWDCELQEFPEHYHGKDFSPASTIRKKLDALLDSKDPSRLIVKTDHSSISELVYLEGYDCKEIYAGVYEFSVSVTEYKAASIRNSEIPEIPRPGKIPQTPPVQSIDDDYDSSSTAQESWNTWQPWGPGNGTPTLDEKLDKNRQGKVNDVFSMIKTSYGSFDTRFNKGGKF